MAPSHQYLMHTILQGPDTSQILRRACRVSGKYRQQRTLTPFPGHQTMEQVGKLAFSKKAVAETAIHLAVNIFLPATLYLFDTTDGGNSVAGPAKENVHILALVKTD